MARRAGRGAGLESVLGSPEPTCGSSVVKLAISAMSCRRTFTRIGSSEGRLPRLYQDTGDPILRRGGGERGIINVFSRNISHVHPMRRKANSDDSLSSFRKSSRPISENSVFHCYSGRRVGSVVKDRSDRKHFACRMPIITSFPISGIRIILTEPETTIGKNSAASPLSNTIWPSPYDLRRPGRQASLPLRTHIIQKWFHCCTNSAAPKLTSKITLTNALVVKNAAFIRERLSALKSVCW